MANACEIEVDDDFSDIAYEEMVFEYNGNASSLSELKMIDQVIRIF